MTLAAVSPRTERSRPSRVASVCVLGAPARQRQVNLRRGELLTRVASEVSGRPGWRDLDAVLFPGGYFRLAEWFGPISAAERREQLVTAAPLQVCRDAAATVATKSPGCLVVAGVDTNRRPGGWNGDHLVVAFDEGGLVGSARKNFPSANDVNESESPAYLLFDQDADDPARFVTLASGAKAVLGACYDAFAFAELALGPTAKRANLCYMARRVGGHTVMTVAERNRFMARFADALAAVRPSVNLIAVHGFKRPGQDLYWQRHGVATASAALDGALVVGAAHYNARLPGKAGESALAAFAVERDHLHRGPHRTACAHKPIDAFEVGSPGGVESRALVRLYEAA